MDRKEGMAMEEWSRNRYAWMKQWNERNMQHSGQLHCPPKYYLDWSWCNINKEIMSAGPPLEIVLMLEVARRGGRLAEARGMGSYRCPLPFPPLPPNTYGHHCKKHACKKNGLQPTWSSRQGKVSFPFIVGNRSVLRVHDTWRYLTLQKNCLKKWCTKNVFQICGSSSLSLRT
jgi:hypothetical protein